MRYVCFVVALLLVPILSSLAVAAEKRVALVIGNSAYIETTKLANTRNDATDFGNALKRLGFDVLEGVDLDKRAMERLVRQFGVKVVGADIAFFFYAGHGLQVSGENYLVPIDAKLAAEGDVDFEAIQLRLILRQMERDAKASIVLLDACRDNPLARNLARSMGTRSAQAGQGLTPVQTGSGTLIGFSTQPGNVALDGDGRNSPYTTALLNEIEVGGRDLHATLAAVRGAVMRATNNRQVPWEHTSLIGPVMLKGATSAVAVQPQQSPPQSSEAERAWSMVKDSSNVELLEAFATRYSDSFFAVIAKGRLADLKAQRPVAPNTQVDADRPAQRTGQAKPYLGVRFTQVDEEKAKDLGLTEKYGVIIVQITADSPAQASGLKLFDTIVAMNGDTIQDHQDLARKLSESLPGARVSFRVIRSGQSETVEVKLGSSEDRNDTSATKQRRSK